MEEPLFQKSSICPNLPVGLHVEFSMDFSSTSSLIQVRRQFSILNQYPAMHSGSRAKSRQRKAHSVWVDVFYELVQSHGRTGASQKDDASQNKAICQHTSVHVNAGKNDDVTSAPRLLIEADSLFLPTTTSTIIRLLVDSQFSFPAVRKEVNYLENRKCAFSGRHSVHTRGD